MSDRQPVDNADGPLDQKIRFNWPEDAEVTLQPLIAEGIALLQKYPTMAGSLGAMIALMHASIHASAILDLGFEQGSPQLAKLWRILFLKTAILPGPAEAGARKDHLFKIWDTLVATYLLSLRTGSGFFEAGELFEFTNEPLAGATGKTSDPESAISVSIEQLTELLMASPRSLGEVKADMEDVIYRLYAECAGVLSQEGLRSQLTALLQIAGPKQTQELVVSIAAGLAIPDVLVNPS